MSFANIRDGGDTLRTCNAFEARGEQPTTAFPFCPFFARKFLQHTVQEVAQLLEVLHIT